MGDDVDVRMGLQVNQAFSFPNFFYQTSNVGKLKELLEVGLLHDEPQQVSTAVFEFELIIFD
jgi:hypothetical protein